MKKFPTYQSPRHIFDAIVDYLMNPRGFDLDEETAYSIADDMILNTMIAAMNEHENKAESK